MGGSEKRDFLFRFVPPAIRAFLKLDKEALYSTTDQVTADKITRDILRYVPRSATITDATACIGGSAYSFAQVFHHVNAIEMDHDRYTFLQANMGILPSCINPVRCLHGDALAIAPALTQDVVFIDPPWGGPEYKQLKQVQLFLSSTSLADACRILHTSTAFIVIKVPINFDETDFLTATSGFMKLVHKNSNLRKMHLLILSTGTDKTLP